MTDSAEMSTTTREFTRLYHELRDQTLGRTRWLGRTVVKSPMDLLIIQEIVAETRPDLIIETGVLAGGSTFFLATLMDLLDIDGTVVGIDIDLSAASGGHVKHPRIELIEGSSTDPEIVDQLKARAAGRRVMVDLDADHSEQHVAGELEALASLVTPGCYLIVEDTWIGRSVRPEEGPGPAAALEAWLAEGQPFEVDRWRERLLLTHNAGGYLRRLDDPDTGPGGPPRLDEFFVAHLDRDEEAIASGAGEAAMTPEQLARNRHQQEFEELRRYARSLEAELEELGRPRRASGLS
jgi:cephalosporin hydroxylase